MNGLIFQNLTKFDKFQKIWKQSGDFAQNLARNWANWHMHTCQN